MNLEPEIIRVVTESDGMSARRIYSEDSGKKFKIQEIMLGAGSHRKAIPYTKFFLQEHVECRAEILPNGKLRIL